MGNTEGALKPESVSTKQRRIAELAKTNPKMVFTSLNHHLDEEWLRYAYDLTRKDGAVGVDGRTAADYDAKLEDNLRDLLGRIRLFCQMVQRFTPACAGTTKPSAPAAR